MKLNREDVLHIARLARLGLEEDEINRLSKELSALLEHFEVLQQVDTTGVEPTSQSTPVKSVLKEDIIKSSYAREDILSNAPRREGDYVRIRVVME
ncbi:Asp-tRNA(Asn)/Glu-tRNA(Gln) amidotransferase subunit GatC [Dehalococcoides mccartyi]|uniref:Aspartyl/glutamyl-tRNA(Asn/Gln) amidotransferase subunit C n=1 Tax=Dehalococcoides mccartyi (strain CBDB1) TaxID=255470 RepID=GATC_DEHMC|nr:Asp-tRNA(Asn)/Glu-tRNA(Gln) amidotransferase subunit GatC [Dehalococcoides mccartyi]Q3ZYM6.1 RecName: Full=Aspartyl/glutamyl-tRNA(Asn/Gln) amidotransferase subunit C; Short=Asp/Glu-ADT subunit C [Dehalococcoides mccartyi CBDB1]BEL01263.1 Asp-tRNA(Asn)/Glu-tRNA(Gln) amidotransferase subunit GatC [Dehalococcoides mccartyi]CAI83341.1 glutamyl-tRNA(gln) amidotransferase, C subunit [Dehalococcoides mccartyi CBDB1]